MDRMDRRTFASLAAAGLVGAAIPDALRAAVPPTRRRAQVNAARLNGRLADLRRFGGTPDGGTNRPAYTDADREARAWVLALMREAGLETTVDVAGNLIGRRAGTRRGLAPLVIGSHIDTVPFGGSYDGTLGSLAAIEVAQALGEAGERLAHPLEVIVFQNEEGGVVGSRALVGELHEADLDQRTRSGKTMREGMAFIGADVSRLAEAHRAPGSIAAYVELHIEQGGTLERDRVNVGVVEGIVGLNWWDVTITGFANHAGTTPMDSRRDAMLAAGRFIDAVNRTVRAMPGRQVATVGRLQAFPGAPNVVPGRVECSLEIRDLDAAVIARVYDAIVREATAIGEATGTSFAFAPTQASAPARMHPAVMDAIGRAADAERLTHRVMPSGAGHDAQHMAALGPSGMIFVPSRGGISHSPAEYTSPEDCARGAAVLLRTVRALDAAPPR
jgi:N-carbamoyl-L-amino-acid hydrolase